MLLNYTIMENEYYSEIDTFYTSICLDDNKKCIVDIILGKNKDISLKILDWVTSTYPNNIDPINVNFDPVIKASYQKHRGYIPKGMFCPFRRGPNIINYTMKFNGIEITIKTTVYQLKFFKFIIECNIISYVLNNLPYIKKKLCKNSINSNPLFVIEF